ncbi:MAG: hypothetical protein K2F79_05380, partial [Muribaculaceae bacterium]|nr:hypothetical protein [Muribaculaceae bacterium]
VYTFRDFLEERVHGDYTHVLLRRTMLRHPYEENVRIHEGVFCLSFYKDAGEVRFVNSVVQERDRSRDDRVTFSLVPDNEATLSRHSQALAILCERFGEDLRQTAQGRSVMCRHLLKMHRFTTMLGHRSAASAAERELAAIGCPVPTLWRTLRRLRLGPAFFAVARLYVKLKFAIGIRPE